MSPGGVRQPLWTRPGPRNVPGGVTAPPDVPTQPSRPTRLPGGPPCSGRRLPGSSDEPGSQSRALAEPAGTPPRFSVEGQSRRGLSSSARQFLEPPSRTRRPSAHGCDRRVSLLVAVRTPPTERPQAHWSTAPARAHWPARRPRSLAPAVRGGYLLAPPLRCWPLSCFLGSGLISNPIRSANPLGVGGGERNPTQFKPRRSLRRQKQKETASFLGTLLDLSIVPHRFRTQFTS